MKRSRFTERQIAFALQQAEAGTPVLAIRFSTHSKTASWVAPSISRRVRDMVE